MAYLDELKKKALNTFGNLPLPELGISEALGGNPTSYNIKRLGITQSTVPQNQSYQNYTPVPQGDVAGASTSGGSGGGGGYTAPSGSDNGTTNLQGLADESKQSNIDAIKSRLGLIRDTVNRQIGTAKGVRDELVGNIGETYGGLRTEAQNRVGTALENLGQERTGVYNTYGTAKGESRRALESAMLKNRMLARAMGRLNSSFYDDRQAEATETGARNISGLAREEAGKVAGIGTRETETKNWGEETQVKIAQEEAQLKTQADREYQTKVDEAMAMEKAFGIDSENELRQAEIEYQSKLDGINQYIQNRGLRIAEIMATAGITGAGINQFSAYTPELQNVLGNNQSLSRASNTEIPTFAGVSSSQPSSLSYFNQTQPNSYLDELKKYGLYLA